MKNVDIRTELGVGSLLEQLRSEKRMWCEHLGRMTGDRIPVLAVEYRLVGKRDVGRARAKWVPEEVQDETNP